MAKESADKRSVSTDALETLGTIIGEGERRDAIHLAVVPVVADCKLCPGDHVGLLPDGSATDDLLEESLVGIVDPFLRVPSVKKGQRFWLVVYPRKIASLRHVWTHPSIPDALGSGEAVDDAKGKSERWIRDYAERLNVTFTDLVEGAHEYLRSGDYLCQGGKLEGFSTSDEFWIHFERYTGTTVDSDKRDNFFTCSC